MSYTLTHDELEGQAALYALGALDAEEARDFESHLAEGCEACAAELREFESIAADLALSAPQAEPPARARARLLELVSVEGPTEEAATHSSSAVLSAGEPDATASQTKSASPQSKSARGFLVVRANEGQWVDTDDAGVSYKLLFADRRLGTFTTLVRMQPGSRIPRHRHMGVEQCLLLEGDLSAGSITMAPGDFNCSLPESVHDEIKTEGGALFLIVSPAEYEVVEQHA